MVHSQKTNGEKHLLHHQFREIQEKDHLYRTKPKDSKHSIKLTGLQNKSPNQNVPQISKLSINHINHQIKSNKAKRTRRKRERQQKKIRMGKATNQRKTTGFSSAMIRSNSCSPDTGTNSIDVGVSSSATLSVEKSSSTFLHAVAAMTAARGLRCQGIEEG